VAAATYPRVVDARDHAAFFLNLSRTGGPVVPYRAAGRPAFLVNRPDHAARVLADREGAFHNPYHPYAELAGHYAPAGSLLLRLRRSGGPGAAGEAARAMRAAAAVFACAAASAGEVGVDEALKRLTFRSTTRLLFGVDPGALAEEFVSAIGFIEECWGNGMFREGAGGPPALAAPYARAVAVQDGAADWIIRRAGLGRESEGLRTAVIRTLLNGYNATATALAWTLHLLAAHPDEQQRLRADLRAASAAEDDGRAARLPALRRVVREALRLYPPAWMLGRAARRPVRLGEVEIPAGAIVSVSPYAMQRHPALWERPSEFRPDRFAEAPGDRPRLAYLPFGAGTRRCPAGAMVPGHVEVFLAAVLRDLRVEPANAAPVRPRGLVALRPDPPLRLRFLPE
jgi:cytochrome P450